MGQPTGSDGPAVRRGAEATNDEAGPTSEDSNIAILQAGEALDRMWTDRASPVPRIDLLGTGTSSKAAGGAGETKRGGRI